jgi:hypothetical protein
MILILGLAHTPLPQADFHNIRHHDGAGEVCEHHDHLLRWHPGAGRAEDVAVLHWHWFLPGAGPTDTPPSTPKGPALHAHVVDWQASTWEEGPPISADTTSRGAVPEPPPGLTGLVATAPRVSAVPAVPRRSEHSFGATFAPTASLACLLQRWHC